MSAPLRVKKRSKEYFGGNLLNLTNLEDLAHCGRSSQAALSRAKSMLDLGDLRQTLWKKLSVALG
jgi:hypothetical protein